MSSKYLYYILGAVVIVGIVAWLDQERIKDEEEQAELNRLRDAANQQPPTVINNYYQTPSPDQKSQEKARKPSMLSSGAVGAIGSTSPNSSGSFSNGVSGAIGSTSSNSSGSFSNGVSGAIGGVAGGGNNSGSGYWSSLINSLPTFGF